MYAVKHKPGTKVLIIEDCRDGGPATGQVGVYEGDFSRGAVVRFEDRSIEYCFDEFVKGSIRYTGGLFIGRLVVDHVPYWSPSGQPHPVSDSHPITHAKEPAVPFWFDTTNPRIRLPDGSVIWGDECWWGDAETAPPLDEAQAGLKQHKAVLAGMLQALAEEE